jgi:hypothetical protein
LGGEFEKPRATTSQREKKSCPILPQKRRQHQQQRQLKVFANKAFIMSSKDESKTEAVAKAAEEVKAETTSDAEMKDSENAKEEETNKTVDSKKENDDDKDDDNDDNDNDDIDDNNDDNDNDNDDDAKQIKPEEKPEMTEEEKKKDEEKRKEYKDWPLKEIKEPHENDVMYGRGGGTNHHTGNKRYRKLVEDRKLDYVNSKRLDKPLVALDIIRTWRGQVPPGRFLKMDEKTGLWLDVGDKKAREKTSQALREKAPLIRKQQEEERQVQSNDDEMDGEEGENKGDKEVSYKQVFRAAAFC